jgi:hypothetical protein
MILLLMQKKTVNISTLPGFSWVAKLKDKNLLKDNKKSIPRKGKVYENKKSKELQKNLENNSLLMKSEIGTPRISLCSNE